MEKKKRAELWALNEVSTTEGDFAKSSDKKEGKGGASENEPLPKKGEKLVRENRVEKNELNHRSSMTHE